MKPNVRSAVEHFSCSTKTLGIQPGSWSAIKMSYNDRTPEGSQGSKEIRV